MAPAASTAVRTHGAHTPQKLRPRQSCSGSLLQNCAAPTPSKPKPPSNRPPPRSYVTPGAFVESAVEFGIPRDVALRNWDGCIQARAALFLPGGRAARMLSRNPTVLVVNDTAFAHGGLLPVHGEGGLGGSAAAVGWCWCWAAAGRCILVSSGGSGCGCNAVRAGPLGEATPF